MVKETMTGPTPDPIADKRAELVRLHEQAANLGRRAKELEGETAESRAAIGKLIADGASASAINAAKAKARDLSIDIDATLAGTQEVAKRIAKCEVELQGLTRDRAIRLINGAKVVHFDLRSQEIDAWDRAGQATARRVAVGIAAKALSKEAGDPHADPIPFTGMAFASHLVDVLARYGIDASLSLGSTSTMPLWDPVTGTLAHVATRK